MAFEINYSILESMKNSNDFFERNGYKELLEHLTNYKDKYVLTMNGDLIHNVVALVLYIQRIAFIKGKGEFVKNVSCEELKNLDTDKGKELADQIVSEYL